MNKITLILVLAILVFKNGFSQVTTNRFTLDDVIRIAQEQSPDAILAKHSFRASYWQYRSFKAAYLPALSFSGTLPDLNRSFETHTNENGDYVVPVKRFNNLASLSVTQNLGLTGGTFFVDSKLRRNETLDTKGSVEYISTPVRVGFEQPIFAFNKLKWNKKIEPLVYEEAKKKYIEAVEGVSIKAISRFFDLANAQLNLNIAKINYSNSDTLFKIAQGRYNIGTIAENDLLQMQLSLLNAQTDLNKAEIELESQKTKLRSFLGYNERMNFDLVLPDSIPSVELTFQQVMDLAQKNNPDVIERQRRQIEAQRDVAQAIGQRGRNITLNASYGITHEKTKDIRPAYETPFLDEQQLQIGFKIPIVDWGQGRGRVKMAESRQELVDVQISQEQIDFEQNIYVQVMQFNLQDDQVNIASTAERIAQSRYDVTKQRFLIGKIDVLNLNDALKEKDNSKRSYIQSLRNYWDYFYKIRQLTLFDFLQDKNLEQDFEIIVN